MGSHTGILKIDTKKTFIFIKIPKKSIFTLKSEKFVFTLPKISNHHLFNQNS